MKGVVRWWVLLCLGAVALTAGLTTQLCATLDLPESPTGFALVQEQGVKAGVGTLVDTALLGEAFEEAVKQNLRSGVAGVVHGTLAKMIGDGTQGRTLTLAEAQKAGLDPRQLTVVSSPDGEIKLFQAPTLPELLKFPLHVGAGTVRGVIEKADNPLAVGLASGAAEGAATLAERADLLDRNDPLFREKVLGLGDLAADLVSMGLEVDPHTRTRAREAATTTIEHNFLGDHTLSQWGEILAEHFYEKEIDTHKQALETAASPEARQELEKKVEQAQRDLQAFKDSQRTGQAAQDRLFSYVTGDIETPWVKQGIETWNGWMASGKVSYKAYIEASQTPLEAAYYGVGYGICALAEMPTSRLGAAFLSVPVGRTVLKKATTIGSSATKVLSKKAPARTTKTGPLNPLPELPKGYHYKTVGAKKVVSRNPGSFKNPKLTLEKGKVVERPRPVKKPRTPHGNSLECQEPTHVYAIFDPKGNVHKIGESMQGYDKFGRSLRAEQQVKQLRKETGQEYVSRVRKEYPNKRAAKQAETTRIQKFRGIHGPDTLPGNKTNH